MPATEFNPNGMAAMGGIMMGLRGVKKAFGKKIVLNGVDIDIRRGESVVIIGGSGTGKSVLLKSILGLVEADSGSIKIDGKETIRLRGKAREAQMKRFGMLFQGGALFDSLPVWQNVAFGLIQGRRVEKITMTDARDIAMAKLAAVGLKPEVGDMFPAELSGGMQKRVGLARAIATEPEIIFFDEPTTGLDPIMADIINDLIVDCVKQLGATTLTITHDMASARKIAHRIAMLHEGRLIWNGPVSEIDNSGNPYVDQFIHGRAQGPISMQVGTP
jgi:phospholipid/cholesterol/gamma-HCH transport system ATP-binding protein